MTLQLTINGVDFTDKWRVYESRWTSRAWMGESAQGEFVIDDPSNDVDHADLKPRKIVEVWEDASGSPVCMYRGRVANKTLGMAAEQTQPAMRWTVFTEDYNIDLRGIRLDASRPEETDEARVEAIRLAVLHGASSTHPEARNSTDLGNTYAYGGTAITLLEENYTDTNPFDVLTRIAEQTGRIFFVYLDTDGDGELYYADRLDEALLSDIEITDDGEADGADGIDIFAAYKGPQAGDHAGQEVITGGAVRWGPDGELFEESNIDSSAAEYDKWEETLTNDLIVVESQAESYLNKVYQSRRETDTLVGSIDMRAQDAHRLRAGQMVQVRRRRANRPDESNHRAVVVTHEPIGPDEDGEARYRVTFETGNPILAGTIPRRRFKWRTIPERPDQPTAGTCTRLYFSSNASAMSASPALSAGWDTDSRGTTHRQLKSTADGSYSTSHQVTDDSTGYGGSEDVLHWSGTILIDSAMATVLAAGGATLRAQLRSRARFGIGISESSQDIISQISARVTQGDSTTIRGTAVGLHSLGSSAGSAKFPAQSTKLNRVYPPAAASTQTMSAVAGTVAGDYLIIEVGCRNFTTVPTGSAIAFTNSVATDLPEDEVESAALNSWVEFCTDSTPGDDTEPVGGSGDSAPGDSTKYAPLNHVHAHGLLSADDLHYHDETQLEGSDDYVEAIRTDSDSPGVGDDEDDGYRAGDIWVDRTAGEAFILTDGTAGAAVWEQFVPSGSISEITDIPTAETDTALVLKPDGAGGVEWAAESGGGGGEGFGGPLARTIVDPGTQDTYTTTTTLADVDAALAVTFTAPDSGEVLIRLHCQAYPNSSTGSLQWGIREGSTDVILGTQVGVDLASGDAVQYTLDLYKTGLTPGNSYTYKWAAKHGTNSWTMRWGGGDGEQGPAVMEVWDAVGGVGALPSMDGRRYSELSEEFLGTTTWLGSTPTGSGSGGTLPSAATSTHPGILQMNTGTSSTGNHSLAGVGTTAAGVVLGTGQVVKAMLYVQIPTLSDGTNTFTFRFGLTDTFNTTAGANEVGWRYSHGVNGGEWQGVCANASTESTVDSNVPVVAGTWYCLEFTITGTASVQFFVDGTSVGTASTNIPTAGLSPFMNIKKSAGGTSRGAILDFVKYRFEWAGGR